MMDSKSLPHYEECLLRHRHIGQNSKQNNGLKGPLRVIRLCALGILLPCFLVALILFMRYRVYVEQLYPLAVSDMRMLDNRISTTWCQRQLVRTNATFNAFLLPDAPKIAVGQQSMRMVRHLELEDDTKEYWGFYLLKGSTVTISTCVRWPGASLIVIRGHKHLHECAYIGDNSSEELDELTEAISEKIQNSETGGSTSNDNAPSNTPDLMKRHREEVEFHVPSKVSDNHKLQRKDDDSNNDITDPKTMRQILASLNDLKTRKSAHMHIQRNSTIGKGELNNFRFTSAGPFNQTVQTTPLKRSESEEILSDVLRKLQQLGGKGDRVLEKLAERYTKIKDDLQKGDVFHLKGRQYQKPPVKYSDSIDPSDRKRRSLVLEQELNENDEESNLGIEEGFIPDGIADHHSTINETTLNDKSNSEFWSSFSSSEEALLNCAGLILNLPLTPHTKCVKNLAELEVEAASLPNKITYKVPTNGYYFFVFNSENEVQTNYIRVQFHIDKKVYNVTNSISQCRNSTSQCEMELKFFSSEKLVMELPVKEEQDMFNEEFVVVSVCEPRTSVYLICVLAVPILVILFAFQ